MIPSVTASRVGTWLYSDVTCTSSSAAIRLSVTAAEPVTVGHGHGCRDDAVSSQRRHGDSVPRLDRWTYSVGRLTYTVGKPGGAPSVLTS